MVIVIRKKDTSNQYIFCF